MWLSRIKLRIPIYQENRPHGLYVICADRRYGPFARVASVAVGVVPQAKTVDHAAANGGRATPARGATSGAT